MYRKSTLDSYYRFGICKDPNPPYHLTRAFRKFAYRFNLGTTPRNVKTPQQHMEYACQELKGRLCELTKEQTCPLGEIRVRCGSKVRCHNVLDLQRRMQKHPSYAQKFSTWQKQRIHALSKRATDRSRGLPCYVQNGMEKWCLRKDRGNPCQFHQRTLLKALFSSEARRFSDKECYLPDDFIASIQCDKLKPRALRAICLDIQYQAIASLFQDTEVTLKQEAQRTQSSETLVNFYVMGERMQLLETVYRKSRDWTPAQMCETIKTYQAYKKKQNEPSRIFTMLETLVNTNGSLVFQVDAMEALLKKLFRGHISHNQVRYLTFLINSLNLIVENNLSWTQWLLAIPYSRKIIKKMLEDPHYAFVFFLSLTLGDVTANIMKDTVGPMFKLLHIHIPTTKIKAIASASSELIGTTGIGSMLRGMVDKQAAERNPKLVHNRNTVRSRLTRLLDF